LSRAAGDLLKGVGGRIEKAVRKQDVASRNVPTA